MTAALSPQSFISPGRKTERLDMIQLLRVYAAVMVLMGHARHEVKELAAHAGIEGTVSFWLPGIGIGSAMFLITNGFLMFYAGERRFGQPQAQKVFLVERLMRLLPMYWLFLALMVVAILLVGPFLSSTRFDPLHILSSFLLIPFEREVGGIRPILATGWAIEYIFWFNILFSFFLATTARRAMTGLIVLLMGTYALGLILEPQHAIPRFLTDSLILQFAIGMAIAFLRARGVRLPLQVGIALFVAGCALFYVTQNVLSQYMQLEKAFVGGPPAALMVAGLALSRAPEKLSGFWAWQVRLSASSYALFLSHPFTLGMVHLAWWKLGLTEALGLPAFFAASVATSVAVGWWIHVLVEKRLNALTDPLRDRWLARLRRQPAQPVEAA